MVRERGRAAAKAVGDPAALFAALGDRTRLRLVSRLCARGPLSIARLTDDADVSRQAVSKHLRLMEDAGLVSATRQGRETVWELRTARLEGARRYLDIIAADWDDALSRLKDFVEG